MISNKKGLLTPQNVNNYIEKVSLKAKNFNIEPYANQVQKALETKWLIIDIVVYLKN